MSVFTELIKKVQFRITGTRALEVKEVLGKSLTARYGVIRNAPDYDDAWLLALSKHAQVVFDIGSNMGQAALTILLSESVKHLVLVDPNPNALSIAAENVIRNAGTRYAYFNCAFVGSLVGDEIEFWTIGSGAAGSKYESHAKTASKRHSHYSVLTTTIDYLSEQLRIVPDLVKLDIEGSEYEALLGSIRIARDGRCRFLVEMHSNVKNPMAVNAANVLRWCTEVNYSAYYLKDHIPLSSAEYISHRGRCHLLLQPADMEYPLWLRDIQQGSPLESVLIVKTPSNLH